MDTSAVNREVAGSSPAVEHSFGVVQLGERFISFVDFIRLTLIISRTAYDGYFKLEI